MYSKYYINYRQTINHIIISDDSQKCRFTKEQMMHTSNAYNQNSDTCNQKRKNIYIYIYICLPNCKQRIKPYNYL